MHRVQRGVDPGGFPGRHLVHHAGCLLGEHPQLLCLGQPLDLLQGRLHDLRDALHERAVEYATQRLDVGDARVALEPHRV